MLNTLVIGDGFIPAQSYLDAFTADTSSTELVQVRNVAWGGSKARHHELQQVMETSGANAIPAPAELLAAVGDAQALCLHFAPVGRELLAAAPGLKLVSVARTGLENVDLAEATARGIGVVPAFGRNAGAVAELQIGLMLAEARNIARADASIKTGGWRKDFPGARIEIADSTVGMIGFGQVGRIFATRLAGFGPRMLAFDPFAADATLARHHVDRAITVEEVFATADFIVVQARHTTQTDRFIGAAQFAAMKPGAYFINVSRSRLVDTKALLDVLQSGLISGAGLDVFDDEPLPADSPWRALDNVTMTTHFGGDTASTNRTSAKLVAAAVLEYARTGTVQHAVNAVDLGW
ncbi:MAG TPA: NAD(P)-dependent oxidoreductase [Kineosporiaceae bacterium]|nr:NAD(P)-dependent oxidoreductase [Kineosporiaceae bacterium]